MLSELQNSKKIVGLKQVVNSIENKSAKKVFPEHEKKWLPRVMNLAETAIRKEVIEKWLKLNI